MYNIKHRDDLKEISEILDLSLKEAAHEALYLFYESAGLEKEVFTTELDRMTEEELYEVFDDLFNN